MEERRYTEANEDRAQRPRKKKRKRKHYFLKFLCVVLVLAATVAFALSPFFTVEKIEVKGNNYYDSKKIVQMSGLKTGGNLFKTSARTASKKLLQDSYFEDAKIKRALPDTFVIEVRERKEAAAVPYGKEYIIIDSKTNVLKKVAKEPKLTILTKMTIKTMTMGEPLEVKEKQTLNKTLKLLRLMKKEDLFFMKVEISSVTIRAYIYENLVCKGTPKDIMANLRNGNLQDVLYDLYEKDITKGTVTMSGMRYCSFSPEIDDR